MLSIALLSHYFSLQHLRVASRHHMQHIVFFHDFATSSSTMCNVQRSIFFFIGIPIFWVCCLIAHVFDTHTIVLHRCFNFLFFACILSRIIQRSSLDLIRYRFLILFCDWYCSTSVGLIIIWAYVFYCHRA